MIHKKMLVLLLLAGSLHASSQPIVTSRLRAFPITDYVVALTDSIKVVQIHLPGGPVIKEGQIGLMKRRSSIPSPDTAILGWGKCRLIKGDFYYFDVKMSDLTWQPVINDLLYTMVDVPATLYTKRIIPIASHAIQLQDVHETPLYNPVLAFNAWTNEMESKVIDSMAADIRYTGGYFLANDSSMDKEIKSGNYKGRKVLSVMATCKPSDVEDFLDYMIVRPRLYAGQSWKISEVFATWASEGAPTVSKN